MSDWVNINIPWSPAKVTNTEFDSVLNKDLLWQSLKNAVQTAKADLLAVQVLIEELKSDYTKNFKEDHPSHKDPVLERALNSVTKYCPAIETEREYVPCLDILLNENAAKKWDKYKEFKIAVAKELELEKSLKSHPYIIAIEFREKELFEQLSKRPTLTFIGQGLNKIGTQVRIRFKDAGEISFMLDETNYIVENADWLVKAYKAPDVSS